MKKLLSVLLSILMISALPALAFANEAESTIIDTSVVINETNFPDKYFRAYVSENFDTNSDSSLSAEEIENAKKIYIEGSPLSSLKGIEYLTNLKGLVCGDTALAAVDLSANTKLVYLDCSDNRLKELDVSMLPELQKLDCCENMLTTLDISNNTKLLKLCCCENQLTGLDISNNTLLLELDCSDNKIASLDTSNNSQLIEIDVEGNPFADTKKPVIEPTPSAFKLFIMRVENYIDSIFDAIEMFFEGLFK